MKATNGVIRTALRDDQLEACLDVVQSLRPHLQKETFLIQVKEMMQQGYSLLYIEEDGKGVAFAGFRYMHMFYCGKIIYIDDLATLPIHRGKGYGSQLLDHIIHLAQEKGLNGVHLDSGYQRADAHRLYLNKGFQLSSHHFALQLNPLS